MSEGVRFVRSVGCVSEDEFIFKFVDDDGDSRDLTTFALLSRWHYNNLIAELKLVREQRNALRARLQQYAGEVQRAMYRATSTIEQWEKERSDG